nr:hop-22(29)-ene synthease [Cibotium barometz]
MMPYSQEFYNEVEALKFNDDRTLDEAIKSSQDFLLSKQHPEGFWWAELESNVSITADTVLLYKILGIDGSYPVHKMENYIRRNQRSHGGWELCYGDGGELSVSIEAYIALRLLNVPTTDPALQKALRFIICRGGVTKARIFTKLCLAMLGCFDWKGIPSLPAWVMLLPSWFLTNIYEMSSWARGCTVPLVVVFDKKPVFRVTPPACFDELYVEGRKQASVTASFRRNWTDFFVVVDYALKAAERWGMVPFRQRGLREAEKWVVERQEDTGDWAGIFPAMFYSILCLKTLGYEVTDPVIHRGLLALKGFSMETADQYWVQPCVSPVWDTALVVRSLVESGMPPDHPALQQAGEWLLKKQITQHGDWSFKNHSGYTGGWAFEFSNRWYPDVDDSAVVVMALDALKLPNESVKQGAIARAVNWINSMQCKAGGWAAFDKDNDQDWLNSTPYGDLKAMIDPNTSDVTARVLEMVGRLKLRRSLSGAPSVVTPPESISRGLAYLRKEQEKEGCWFGRWGVNYIYGTCGVLVALSLVGSSTHKEEIARGAKWLVEVQNTGNNSIEDGGWGETCCSYNDPALKGKGDAATPSQTAWALMGLLAAGDALGKYEVDSIEHGVRYLLSKQRRDGSWHEASFTGTGFPGHFYLKYHFYAQHFTLTALARYRSRLEAKQIVPSR